MSLRPISTGSVRRRRSAKDDSLNARTMVYAIEPAPSPTSFHELFVRHYERVKALLEAVRSAGLVILAFDESSGDLAGSICLEAREGRPRALIVGRHSEVDLPLPARGELSLRHLAVVLTQGDAADEVRFSVLDLRTRGAFYDEAGRRLEAVTAEGPIFLSCGGYQLFFLPSQTQDCWPDDAEDGWLCIPDRVYLEESTADPERRRRGKRRRRRDDDTGKGRGERKAPVGYSTMVHTSLGPRFAKGGLLIEDGESELGTLEVEADERDQRLVLGAKAARRGILLGRYDRCNAASILAHAHISRVHLLFVQVDDNLYAIDTGSTNGTWVPRSEEELEAVRVLRLPRGESCSLELGEELATVRWTPFSPPGGTPAT